MAYKVQLSPAVQKRLDGYDRPLQSRLVNFLADRLANLDNPRSIGSALTGAELGGLWRYRVGDYRIIAKIEDDRLVILVVAIGHRSDIYR